MRVQRDRADKLERELEEAKKEESEARKKLEEEKNEKNEASKLGEEKNERRKEKKSTHYYERRLAKAFRRSREVKEKLDAVNNMFAYARRNPTASPPPTQEVQDAEKRIEEAKKSIEEAKKKRQEDEKIIEDLKKETEKTAGKSRKYKEIMIAHNVSVTDTSDSSRESPPPTPRHISPRQADVLNSPDRTSAPGTGSSSKFPPMASDAAGQGGSSKSPLQESSRSPPAKTRRLEIRERRETSRADGIPCSDSNDSESSDSSNSEPPPASSRRPARVGSSKRHPCDS